MIRRVSALLVLMLLALGVLGEPARADANAWGGLGYSLGNGTCNAADLAKLQPLIDQLKKPVNAAKPFAPTAGLGLNQAQALAKVKQIRANVAKAITVAKGRSGAARAKFIQDQFDAGNVCVSWGMTVLGTCIIDKAVGKKASEVTVMDIKPFLCVDLNVYDPALVCGADTIAHENTHAGQSYVHDAIANPTADRVRAATGKKYACNEVEAHGDAVTWYTALEAALCDANLINPAVPLPPGLNPAIKTILEALRNIANAVDRAAAIAKLKAAAKSDKEWNGVAKACYENAKQAFSDYLAGTITKAQLKAALNNIKWKHYTGWLDHKAFVGKLPPDKLYQSSSITGPGPDIATGLQEIMDFEVVDIGPEIVLLVVGRTFTGQGELQVYFDTDADELFEESTRQVLFTNDPRLQNNMDLFVEPESGEMFVYDAVSQLIWVIQDTNLDMIPDQLAIPVINPNPALEDFVQFEFLQNQPFPTIVCHEAVDSTNPAIVFDGPTMLLQDQNSDGFFETMQPATFEQFQLWAPTFEISIFQPGQPTMDLYGLPGANLEVWLTNPNGDFLELRALGLGQGIPQADTVNLVTPFNVGEELVIVDVTHGLLSSNFLVQGNVPQVTPYCFGDGSGTGCPCANFGGSGEGCAHSGGNGATLGSSGNPEVANDTFALDVTGAPASVPGLFFSGSAQPGGGQGFPFGDGLLCAGGAIVRLQVVITNGSGQASSTIGISAKDGSTPGTTRYYQYWFRDVGGPCNNDFNTSGALSVTWQ